MIRLGARGRWGLERGLRCWLRCRGRGFLGRHRRFCYLACLGGHRRINGGGARWGEEERGDRVDSEMFFLVVCFAVSLGRRSMEFCTFVSFLLESFPNSPTSSTRSKPSLALSQTSHIHFERSNPMTCRFRSFFFHFSHVHLSSHPQLNACAQACNNSAQVPHLLDIIFLRSLFIFFRFFFRCIVISSFWAGFRIR